jgi:hypothetical protein
MTTPRIQVTTIFQRKNETVEFHRMSRPMLDYVEKEYIGLDKMISRASYQSSDKLSKTVISHFMSDEDRKNYLQDPKIKELLKLRNEHCREKGIRITILTQAYDDNGIISSNLDIID